MIRNGILVVELKGKQFVGVSLMDYTEVGIFDGIPEEMPKNDEEVLVPVLRKALEYWNTEKTLENDVYTQEVRRRLELILSKFE